MLSVGAMFALTVSTAVFAQETLTISNGGASVECGASGLIHEAGAVTGTGCTTSGNGTIYFTGTVGNYSTTLQAVQGTSYYDNGTPDLPFLQLADSSYKEIAAKGVAPGSLNVSFTDTGYTETPLYYQATAAGQNLPAVPAGSQTSSTTTTYDIYLNNTLIAFYPSPISSCYGTGPHTSGYADCTSYNDTSALYTAVPSTDPYSLNLSVDVTAAASNVAVASRTSLGSFSAQLAAVPTPEPGLYGVLSAGLVGLGFVVNRRRKQSKA